MLEVIEKDDAMGKSDMVGRWWPSAMMIGAKPEEPALSHTHTHTAHTPNRVWGPASVA